jgi:hypothetical protein
VGRLMKISVILPTVAGREYFYARTIAAYKERSVHNLQFHTVRDYPTVGEAWNAAAVDADGDYIHLAADDLTPRHGWDTAAIETVNAGYFPASFVYNHGSTPDYATAQNLTVHEWGHPPHMTTDVPFLPMRIWESIRPVLPIHYGSVEHISFSARLAGMQPVVRRRYAFDHWLASVRRVTGDALSTRLDHDYGILSQWLRENWDDPCEITLINWISGTVFN